MCSLIIQVFNQYELVIHICSFITTYDTTSSISQIFSCDTILPYLLTFKSLYIAWIHCKNKYPLETNRIRLCIQGSEDKLNKMYMWYQTFPSMLNISKQEQIGLLCNTIQSGNIRFAKILISDNYPLHHNMVNIACRHGHVDILICIWNIFNGYYRKCMSSQLNPFDIYSCLDYAIEYNQIQVLIWIQSLPQYENNSTFYIQTNLVYYLNRTDTFIRHSEKHVHILQYFLTLPGLTNAKRQMIQYMIENRR